MASLRWISFGFIIALSIFIFWVAPKVEIIPKPSQIDFNAIKSLSEIAHFEWKNASMLFKGQVIGPESITHDPATGDIFTGTYEGLVWKINRELTEAVVIVRTGEDHPNCGSPEYQKVCGRVLGMKLVSGDKLIVADAYFGIIAINTISKKKEFLVQPDTSVNTMSLKLFNSVDVSDEGIVYFTVSSMKWTLEDFLFSFLEADDTGRLYSYSLITKELKLMVSNISFANGLVISHDGKSLLVVELTQNRILKVDIKDPSKISIFVENLVGSVDNIKKGPDNTYFIAIPSLDSLKWLSFVSSYPLVNVWSVWLLPKWILMSFLCFDSNVLQIDQKGKVLLVMHGQNKGLRFITEGYDLGDNILLGSIMNPHLVVLNKNEIGHF